MSTNRDKSEVVVIGSFVQDLAWSTQTFPQPGETRIGQFRTGPGGKGFNQAVASHRQEVPTLFIGCVGNDIFGRGIAQWAANEGVRTELQIEETRSTGAASIVVNNHAENLIVVALGANDYLMPDHIKKFEVVIRSAKVVVSQLECALAPVETALTLAHDSGVVAILNPAPINENVTRELISKASILTPNETEFRFLMSKLYAHELSEDYWDCRDEELHRLCRECQVATVILTLGKNGCFVSHRDDNIRAKLGDKALYYRSPAIDVQPLDTTGAGDAFNGGLAAGLVRYPNDLRAAIRFANTVAGLSTLRHGTAPAMPHYAEVAARL